MPERSLGFKNFSAKHSLFPLERGLPFPQQLKTLGLTALDDSLNLGRFCGWEGDQKQQEKHPISSCPSCPNSVIVSWMFLPEELILTNESTGKRGS